MDPQNQPATRCFVMVYVTQEQKAELSARAASLNTSLSAYARDVLLDSSRGDQISQLAGLAAAITQQADLLLRIETLAAAAVVAPAIAATPHDAPQQVRIVRTRDVLTMALEAAPRVRMRIGSQGEYQPVETSNE